MKGKTIFGAILVSAALCSQGFSFELLNGLLGLNDGGCGECKACANVGCCAKPACCEKACPRPVRRWLAVRRRVAVRTACGCEKCKRCRATPVRDMFGNLKDLFEAKGCQCEACGCEAAKGCCPEPACCAKACLAVCEGLPCALCEGGLL